MAVTEDLILLVDRLRTDSAFIASFQANAPAAIQGYELTPHERDAVITRDSDDFVALGVVSSISQLPPALGGSTTSSQLSWLLKLKLRLLQKLRIRRPTIREPRPKGPFPPGPGPGPPPGPGPGR